MLKSRSRYPAKASSMRGQRFDLDIEGDTSESEHSYDSEDEDSSSAVDVSPPSATGSLRDWNHVTHSHLGYPEEVGPAEVASHQRTSYHSRDRGSLPASRSRSRHHYQRRAHPHQQRAARRQPSPESPSSSEESADDLDEYQSRRTSRRPWPPAGPAAVRGYAQSASSGQTHNVFPGGVAGHPHYPHPGAAIPPSDQLVRFGPLPHIGRPAHFGNTSPPFGYGGPHYPPSHPAGAMPPYFGHDQVPGHPGPLPPHLPPQSRDRSRGQSPPEVPPLSHMVQPHGAAPFGAPPFPGPDLIPYGANPYMPFNPNFPPMPPGMLAHPLYNPIPPRPESPPSVTSHSDTAKDDAIAQLKELIMEERKAREQRDAERDNAIAQAKAAKEAAEARAAADKKIADEAAAAARAAALAEAEAKAVEAAAAAQKAAEELAAAAAADAKKAAEEAAAAAAEEAKKAADEAAAEAVKKAAEEATKAATKKPPPEKKKPIKFKDALGRKFNFPFHLCSTWQVCICRCGKFLYAFGLLIFSLSSYQGVEELIRQAFLHVEVYGPLVAEGRYDLVGPSGDIILPQVWETTVEPDWNITMHMWPIPEKPAEPEPAPAPAPEPEPPAPAPAADPKKKEPAGTLNMICFALLAICLTFNLQLLQQKSPKPFEQKPVRSQCG